MSVRRSSRGLQVTRLVMAAVFVTAGVLAAVAGSWFLAVLLVVGAVGAVLAFRKGESDPEMVKQAAKDYAYPRLIGGVIGLLVFVVIAALGLLD